MGIVGSISRVVLFGANKTEVHGLEGFLELLDERRNIEGRQRGLVTGKPGSPEGFGSDVDFAHLQFPIMSACTYVSQTPAAETSLHVGSDALRSRRIDDPLLFGTLPFRYHFNPSNHRWGLGSHDICFTNKFVPSI